VVWFSQNCPFCHGNENLAPPEILRLPNGDGSWKIRVIPNKFAALAREVPPARTIHRSRRTIQGFGVGDVIVETPDHSQAMAGMSDAHMADIVRIYKTRYDELSLVPSIAHVTIFKNHGVEAGKSGASSFSADRRSSHFLSGASALLRGSSSPR